MTADEIGEHIVQVIRDHGPLSAQEISRELKKEDIAVPISGINSFLYSDLKGLVVKDFRGSLPVWHVKGYSFEATKGLEHTLYRELIKERIITETEARLDYTLKDRRSQKTYHLDLAVFLGPQKFNLEVDGLDHMRADAMVSIQRQLEKDSTGEIEIDWMDNATAYADYRVIDRKRIYTWFRHNLAWCRQFHEELIWPKDIKRNLFLIDNGWQVMRVWNEEIRHDLIRSVADIRDWLSGH